MKALVFAGFLLGGWNVASALSVAKDTKSGKMPGPKSFGYTLAALLGVTGATLSYYSMKGQENPQLLASEDAKEVVCVRCNGLGDLCRGCSGLGADYPEEFGSCDLPPFPCPYCDTTGLASVNENMELLKKGFGSMSHYFDSANQELFGPKYLFSMKDNPKEDYEHPWIQLDDAKASKLFDWIQDKYGIPPEYSQDIWENTPHKYKQEYDFPTEAASEKVRRERIKREYPELFEAERMHGDDRLDRWVEESYGEDYDWVLLGQEQDHDVHEILDDFIVLDDEGNEYEGIAITYRSEGWLTEGKCVICNNEAKFVVEDLPVGPRGFCCEACYADYVGLPVKEEGYYGLASEGKSWQGISLAGTVDEIEEMLGRKKEAESKTFDPKHYNDLVAGKVNSEIKESMREEGWPEDEINLMYAIPHASYAGFIPEVQARELFDEIHKFNDPANQKQYESETQTFEASKGPYTNASQEAFTKSYSRKAKNPWNKITKDVSFPKLGNQGRYSYTSSKITIPAANVTKAGGKKAAISLIRQYTAVGEYARVGWNTRLNSPDDPNNQDLMEKQYGEVMQNQMLGSSGRVGIVMGLGNSTRFQNNPGDYMEDTLTRANISSDNWERQIQGYIDTARKMRDLVRASDGFMKNIKMIGSNYAPVENDGGYGRTDYSARNPFVNAPTEGGYKYDDNDGTLKLPGTSYNYGKEWAILDKIRFYEATPPYKVGKSVAGTSYETEGGYGWRTSGSTTTYMDQALVQGNNGNVASPERWSIQPVSFWGQNYSGDVGYYDMEDWETDRTPNYLYGTLVPWVRMPFMDKTNGDELNDVIIKLWEAKKSIKTKAEAAKKKEEQQAAAKQQREDQTNAINSFYTIQEEIDRLVKKKVNAATAAGIDPADILVYLEDLQVELEAYMTDLDLDEYLMEE
jgi:hypothetical protein